MDGLGVRRAWLVADATFEPFARHFAAEEPDRVERVTRLEDV
jgi:hypothetical protein